MYVKVRFVGHPDVVIPVDSMLTKIEEFRLIILDKFKVQPERQHLIYSGKLLEDGYTFYDYNIRLNNVIQLIEKSLPGETKNSQATTKEVEKEEPNEEKIEYEDAISTFYKVGDLVDARESEGYWSEGKITRIVSDPKEQDNVSSNNSDVEDISNENILYQVTFDNNPDDPVFCKPSDVRPRARKVISPGDLKAGQTVMINFNLDKPGEVGYWYDFKVEQILKMKRTYNLIGTLYLGLESVPQNDTKVQVKDKIFAIEKPIPLEERSQEYIKKTSVAPPKRSSPFLCDKCRDDRDVDCKYCGCYTCAGKESPDEILLCDECEHGFHMKCLVPPLTAVPDDDWYCADCKRDVNDVVAPGAAQQAKKARAGPGRDWGRGMACVGRTKDSDMPADHFGPIPGIEVGMSWLYRIQVSETGLHRPSVAGIHGRANVGAFSIVLSGGYEDDVDNGNEFTYTGSGGRDLSGNKRTAGQSCDQEFSRSNQALACNCAAPLNPKGADAGAKWRDGKPVRVLRSVKMMKVSKYAPKEGIRYDGIYKVVKYYAEKGLAGFQVYKYHLRRDDPNPAPWEKKAKKYPIEYPDGYLEAKMKKDAGKQTLKTLLTSNDDADVSKSSDSLDNTISDITNTDSNRTRKRKRSMDDETKENDESEPIAKKASVLTSNSSQETLSLTEDEQNAINTDQKNAKLWQECLKINESRTKFIDQVQQVFRCIICQGLAISPVTTPCLHNFCLNCIKRAFKVTDSKSCPCCRQSLADFEITKNTHLMGALRIFLPGYDAAQK
ncbi:E3 ubiquitin-protein ligase UHRF1 [Bicyclus anynana]|uniref:RING-type E3 ubiquitin transferase n=1 Tax=Bicyclus anynana TaxID=110368 RepID=A0A6J1P1Y5_BICAN|nr:E3 ubiquitin-protein ligase UHRF1 [Bicyclus anynana]